MVSKGRTSGDTFVRQGNIKYLRRGIYNIAYDPTTSLSSGARARTHDGVHTGPYAVRLLRDVFDIAPQLLVFHFLCALWNSIEPALNIHLSAILLNLIDGGVASGTIPRFDLTIIISGYLMSTLLSAVVKRIHSDVQDALRGHLRAHFLPPLVKTSLGLDLLSSQDLRQTRLLPKAWHFDTEAPGWEFLFRLSEKLRIVFTIVFEIIVLIHAISRKQSPEKEILTALCLAHPVVLWLSPLNGVGGAAHLIWTDNQHFKRLKALFTMAFSEKYRQDLVTDGTANLIHEEYRQFSKALGAVPDSAYALCLGIPRAWYWKFFDDFVLHLPLASYALTLAWSFSPSSLTSIALLQQAAFALRLSVGEFTHDSQMPFSQVSLLAKYFFDATTPKDNMDPGSDQYPDSRTSSANGMKVSFRNVSYQYPNQQREVITNVSFDVMPGQVVVVVGANGSGKSTLMKLLARLFDPISGDICVDDQPSSSFDVAQLRSSMAFLSQSSEIYPVSLRENIELGLSSRTYIEKSDIEDAAHLGGSYDLIQKLPHQFDTVLEPLSTTLPSMGGCPGGASADLEVMMKRIVPEKISISAGEKQRIIASRTFMRLKHSDTRLLVVDEPTSALDTVAEYEIFSRFLECRKGKTMIFVTHRFGNLVKHADLILCVKGGKIVEQGTHDQLVNQANGEYSKMYTTQAAGYE